MMDKNLIKMAGLFSAGLAVGGGVGYLTTSYLIKAKYAQMATDDIAAVKEQYRLLRKEGDLSDPTTIVNNTYVTEKAEPAYKDTVDALGYTNAEIRDSIDYGAAFARNPEEMVARFENLNRAVEASGDESAYEGDDEGDDEVDPKDGVFISQRVADAPYVISYDEFMEDEPDYRKISLTYFEEDETLIDDGETIIPDIESLVTVKAMGMFGTGTTDTDMVYIRNEKHQADFEVARDQRGFAEVILQIRPDKAPIMKMRVDD